MGKTKLAATIKALRKEYGLTQEELALSIDGRKSRLTLNNFIQAGRTMGIDEIVIRRLIVNFKKALPKWMELIRASFLSNDMKTEYENLIAERLKRLE